MKLFVLPLDEKFRPSREVPPYPPHDKGYGVEEDFFDYMREHPEMIADDASGADYHYLPVFWTAYHVNHEHGRTGQRELNERVKSVLLNSDKTFTICQYDDGPRIDTGRTLLFLAARIKQNGIDIPLLSHPHSLTLKNQIDRFRKSFTASFIGALKTHEIRKDMAHILKERSDILISSGSTAVFREIMLRSLVALCPRGSSGNSFRFYEAMQLGVVPFLIGDLDTRPFKDVIDWDKCSLYCEHPSHILPTLKRYSRRQLLCMGRAAKRVYQEYLTYGKWCPYVLEELQEHFPKRC